MMILINLGPYHNFIDVGFMEKKNLQAKGFKGFGVSKTNGKLMFMYHIVERFEVGLQCCMVRENFYVYTLKEHPHIILGFIHTNY